MEVTELQGTTTTKLKRIAWLSDQNPDMKFDCLMHHFSEASLAECFHKLDSRKAVGLDKITKDDYGSSLQSNLRNLVDRMKDMAYRPGPVREVLIPKDGTKGGVRPLGISNMEDKIVQSMFAKVLESIYDPLFLDCSYGFRPNRSCHDAIKGLHKFIYANRCETVIDVDLENFFGTIDHKILEQMLRHKIKDQRFIRYIIRMFKAGILSSGELRVSDEGVPQGSCCSPILSNVMAHYVIDVWFQSVVKHHCRGTVELFRYADDMVICCQYSCDAIRIKVALGNRLTKFGLSMNPTKTKLVSFSKDQKRSGEKQGTFDFLGFTFYLSKSRQGKVVAKVKTSRKKFSSKLKRVSEWARRVCRRQKLRLIWPTFIAKLRGHVNYYGVSFNRFSVKHFLRRASEILFKWLNRRSQRRSYNWEQFKLFMEAYPLPEARVVVNLF